VVSAHINQNILSYALNSGLQTIISFRNNRDAVLHDEESDSMN